MSILWFWPFGTAQLKLPQGSFFSKFPLHVSKHVRQSSETCKMWISSNMRSFIWIGVEFLTEIQFEMLKMTRKLGRQPKFDLSRGSLIGCCWHENGCKCNFLPPIQQRVYQHTIWMNIRSCLVIIIQFLVIWRSKLAKMCAFLAKFSLLKDHLIPVHACFVSKLLFFC